MTEIKRDSAGAVRVSDEVLSVIAGTAALEAEGVAGLFGHYSGGTKKALRRQMARGISVEVRHGSVKASLSIIAKFGSKVCDVARDVQLRVKKEIEGMTGLALGEVNVTVGKIVDEARKA